MNELRPLEPSKRAFVQIQDISGNWITLASTGNQDQLIFRQLQAVQRQYKRLTRAVDDRGVILQMM